MGSKKRVGLTVLTLLLFGLISCSLSAIEVKPDRESKYFEKSYIKPFDSSFTSKLTDGMNIERITGYTDKPEAQVAVWIPLIEPEPVSKTKANEVIKKTDAQIFLNDGAGKDKFPYVVYDAPNNKYYVYKNVKYHWFFEQPDEKKKILAEGNKNGVSGGEIWTPFIDLAGDTQEFWKEMAEGNASGNIAWDKKLFVNRHTTAYDSGIRGSESVIGSKFLQQVGMILTYERAVASIVAGSKSGTAWPQTETAEAQHSGNSPATLPGKVKLASVPDAATFEKFGPDKTIKPKPDDLVAWNLTATIDGKTYDKFTEYNMVYVEDYSYPEVSQDFLNPQGTTYMAKVGGYLGQDMSVGYTNENSDLLPTSPAITNSFEYHLGSDELYKLPNPFKDGEVMFFYLLKANDAYGPYVGTCFADREKTYFTDHHPYWKSQPTEKFDKFFADRYSNAWECKFFEPWEKGVIYYVAYENGDATSRLLHLNDAWKAKDPSLMELFDDIMADLQARTTEEAAEARKAMAELKTFISSSTKGSRKATRFAPIGFEVHLGRCIVGPVTLENIDTQHNQEKEMVPDPETGKQIEVTKGQWTVAGQRVIMPRHFAMNSIEWSDHTCPPAPSAKDNKALKAYYSELRNHPPDMLLTQEVSNCCGNDSPAGSLIKVQDVAEFSKPLIEAEIEDMNNGIIHKIGIPSIEELEAGSQLAQRDLRTGTVKNHGFDGCNEDIDMSGSEWIVVKKDGTEEKLPRIPTDPEGPDKNGIPVEDQRMRFSISPFDNIDSLTPFRGILRTEVEIEALDANQNPTGNLEEIEYESDGKIVANNKIVKDGSGLDKFALNDFDPKVSFHHIFRAAGWYQFRVKAFDRAENGGLGNSREMKFNINVLPASFRTRAIEGK